jgi:pentatricopeptide repeat protein
LNIQNIISLFNEIKDSKVVEIDEVIYNSVIDACFKLNNYKMAVQIYDEMVEQGIKESSTTYGIMIKGYGKYKKIEKSLEIYEKMKS